MVAESRASRIAIQRQPKEDPWAFIWQNFYGLAVYYSLIYARKTKHWELKDDFRNEMLYAMVDAYTKYRDRPLSEQIKIFKTIPFNYYSSKLDRKWMTLEHVPIENKAIVEDEDRFRSLYDAYYEEFLDTHYRLNVEEDTDEKMVLMQILYPSKEFQDFIEEEKDRHQMTKAMLRKFFCQKYKWSTKYFEEVFANVKIAA
jgi:hypothetical protein